MRTCKYIGEALKISSIKINYAWINLINPYLQYLTITFEFKYSRKLNSLLNFKNLSIYNYMSIKRLVINHKIS